MECLRQGVDAPSSTIKIEVDPKSLTEEQRNFVASQLYDGLRFPNPPGSEICPPTYEGFIAAVNYGLEKDKIESTFTIDGALQYSHDLMKELKELRRLIKAAIKEIEQAGRKVEQARKDRMDYIRKGNGGGWNGDRTV
jgi:ribosome recycling factor